MRRRGFRKSVRDGAHGSTQALLLEPWAQFCVFVDHLPVPILEYEGRIEAYLDYCLGGNRFPSCGALGGFVIYGSGSVVESDIDEDGSMTAWPEAVVELLRGSAEVEVLVFYWDPIHIIRKGGFVELGYRDKRGVFHGRVQFRYADFIQSILEATRAVAMFVDAFNRIAEVYAEARVDDSGSLQIIQNMRENLDRDWWELVREIESLQAPK